MQKIVVMGGFFNPPTIAHDENRLNIEKWRGQNLLGFALMQVREKLSKE